MPVVRAQRQIDTAPIPGVRRTAAETNLSTGVGVEAARGQTETTKALAEGQKFGAIADFAATGARIAGSAYGQMVEQERQRADSVALLEADNKLSAWESQRLYDPQNGALTVKGKDAMPLPEQVGEEYGKVTGEIEKGLSTDRQRMAFAKLKANRGQSLDMTLRRHVFGEMQHYEAAELKASVDNSINAAVSNAMDPRRVGIELDSAVQNIKTHAPNLGLGPEQIAQQIEGVTTATHVGVIERLLATDQTKAAGVYFDETKGQIKGDALARIEKALSVGNTRKESQQKTDEILAAGGTLTEQRDKAKSIDDPEVRDQVTQRLEHEAAVSDHAQRMQSEATLKGVYDTIDRTHSLDAIDPTTWSQMTGGERSGVRSYSEHLAKGTKPDTDLPTFYGLLQKAGEDPEAFAKENLLKYKGTLDEGDFKHLAGLQLSIRNGDRNKTEKDLGSFRTHKELVDDTLTLYGIDPKAKYDTPQGKANAQLLRMLDVRMQAFGEMTGKKPTNDDIQRTLDSLLSKSEKTPGSWWGLVPFSKAKFGETDKRLIDLTIADVPDTERAQITAALTKRGRPVSDATILDLYLESKARK